MHYTYFLSLVVGMYFSDFSIPGLPKTTTEENGIAVVELFTSEGCSSCPSADKLLSEFINEADKSKKNIYGLSFHVSYWNYLGWKDRFSKEDYNTRQKAYGKNFGNSSIYTPQMVVNGSTEFVGSSRTKANEAIKNALSMKPTVRVNLNAIQQGEKIKIDYQINGDYRNSILNIALVERNIVSTVTRGENRNRTLTHDNVVRNFISISSIEKGQCELSIPKDINLKEAAIIGYVQKESLAIIGASALDL